MQQTNGCRWRSTIASSWSFVGPIKTVEWVGGRGYVRLIGPLVQFEESRIGGGGTTRSPRCGPTARRASRGSSASSSTAGPIVSRDGDGAGEGPKGELLVVDVTEDVVTGLNDEGTMLVVEWWTLAKGLRRVERA